MSLIDGTKTAARLGAAIRLPILLLTIFFPAGWCEASGTRCGTDGPGGRIAVRVLVTEADEGSPAAGVAVELILDEGDKKPVRLARGETDDRGKVRLEAPGEAIVAVSAAAKEVTKEKTKDVSKGATKGKATDGAAPALIVRTARRHDLPDRPWERRFPLNRMLTGEKGRELEATLRVPKRIRITGKVTDAGGRPVAGARSCWRWWGREPSPKGGGPRSP